MRAGWGCWRSPGTSRTELDEKLARTRALTDRPFGVNMVLVWPQEERLRRCLDAGVGIVSTTWGDPAPLVSIAHERGAIVLHTVSDVAEARRAVDAGVDVIVAQGWEAGGHVRGEVATMALVPAVVDAVAPIPVVAAGGIGDGRGLAAVLMLGASAGWLGTRFVMSAEAPALPVYRDRLAAADATSTVYSSVFDGGWPDAPHRTLRNSTIEMWEAAGRPPSGERPGEGEIDRDLERRRAHPTLRVRRTPARRDRRCRGDVDVCRPIGRARP